MKHFSKIIFLFALITLVTTCCKSQAKNEAVNMPVFELEEINTDDVAPVHFPLIKIVSTENNGSMDFVLEPVTKHVKDSQKSWGDFSNAKAPDPWYEKCEIMNEDGTLIGTGQVKVRGNWTTTYAKKSLRIKFDSKQKMLGLNNNGKFKNWVLLAGFKDASLLRDAVGFEMYRKMFNGYASDCRLVEVEVNGQNLGVYLLAEQQEAKRLGLTEPEKKDTRTDIGYLIEFDNYYYTEDPLESFEIRYGGSIKDYNGNKLYDPQNGYTIKSDITDKAQHDFIEDYMNKLWKICYQAVYNKKYYQFDSNYELKEYTPQGTDDNAKCRECVSQVLDAGSLADMYIFNELICDPDLYLTSFFMSIDFSEGNRRKLTFSAPWDFDSTMGNKNFCAQASSHGNITGIGDMYAGLCQTDVNCEHPKVHANPWMVIFIGQSWFRELVKEHWAAIDTSAVLEYLLSYIDQNSAACYQQSFNYTRTLWGTPSDNIELCELSSQAAASSQYASASYLKQWLKIRFGAVGKIIDEL